jgi:exodeoxyribonuclease V gamma subunit
VLFSRHKAEHRVRAWTELMAVVGTQPDVPWRSLVMNWKQRAKMPYDEVLLVPRADEGDAAARRSQAVGALEVAIDLYRRGLAEPLPLFPALSAALWEGKRTAYLWDGYSFSAEMKDPATALAYAGVDHHGVSTMPALPDDPPGEAAERLARYAHLLYGTLDATAVDVAGEVDHVERADDSVEPGR